MKLPVTPRLISRAGALDRDPVIINGIVEPGPSQDAPQKLRRRPGTSLYQTAGSSNAQGMSTYYNAQGDERIIVANGGALYSAGIGTITATPTAGTAQTISSASSSAMPERGAFVYFGGLLWYIGGVKKPSTNWFFETWYSSDDGNTWTRALQVDQGSTASANASYPPGVQARTVCVHKGYIYLAGFSDYSTGTGATNAVWRSSDGITWTRMSAAATYGPNSSGCSPEALLSDGSTLWIICSYNLGTPESQHVRICNSTDDGATWSAVNATTAPSDPVGGGNVAIVNRSGWLLMANGTLARIGGITSGNTVLSQVWTSTDGVTWTKSSTALTQAVYCPLVLEIDGAPWIIGGLTDLNSPPTVHRTVYAGNAGFSAWSSAGTWSSAPDGAAWDTRVGGGPLNAITFGNGKAFAFWGIPDSANYQSLGYAVSDKDSVYVFSSGTPTSLNLATITGDFCDFAQTYNLGRIAIKTNVALYDFNVSAGTVTQVNDADYPTETVPGAVVLNDVLYVMDTDGNIYNSAEGDFTSWGATDYVAAQFESDGGVAIAKYQNYLVAFGQWTMELFYDAGNAVGSPLLPVQNGIALVGCAAGRSVQNLDDQLFFLAQSKGKDQGRAYGRFVAIAQGTTYQRISTPDIDRIIDLDDLASVSSCVAKYGGHSYYMLTLGTTGITLVYQLTTSRWLVWRTRRTSSTFNPASVAYANGTATAVVAHGMSDGDVAVVSGFAGTGTVVNGTWNAITTSTGTVFFRINSTATGTATGTGTATRWSNSIFPGAAAVAYGTDQLLQDPSNGNIYRLKDSLYQDSGVYMDTIVRLEKLSTEKNEARFMAYADLLTDRVSGNAMLRVSDDDAQTWSKYQPRSLAGQRTRWHRLGDFRRRLLEIRCTDNVAFNADALAVEVL